MIGVTAGRKPWKRVPLPRNDRPGIEQTRFSCSTIIMLDSMRRRRNINPLNGNTCPDDGFMRMIVGRPMFHLNGFIHQFGSYRDSAHQYQTNKHDKVDCFQNVISFPRNSLGVSSGFSVDKFIRPCLRPGASKSSSYLFLPFVKGDQIGVEVQLCAKVIAPGVLGISWHPGFLPPFAPPDKGGGFS
jgi:hypothetical protein